MLRTSQLGSSDYETGLRPDPDGRSGCAGVHSLRSFTSLRLTKQMMVDSNSVLALIQRFAIGQKYLSSAELAPGARPDGRVRLRAAQLRCKSED